MIVKTALHPVCQSIELPEHTQARGVVLIEELFRSWVVPQVYDKISSTEGVRKMAPDQLPR